MSSKDFINLDKDIEKLIRSSEKNIIKGYRDSLKLLKHEMADLYEKHSIDGKLTSDVMNKYNRIKALDKDIQLTVKMIYGANNKEINQALRKAFVDTSKSIMYIVDKDVGKKLQPITKSKDITATINEAMKGLNWKDRNAKHRQDLIYNIQKTVKEGISNGDTYSSMANRLTKTMNVDVNKATTIARTETARVKSQSQKDTLDKVKKSGIEMMKTWNSVSDERVRSSHNEMDGTTVPYDDDFITPLGNKGFGPKLLDDDGEDSINCRCFLTISFI